jgi:hypothetical protein
MKFFNLTVLALSLGTTALAFMPQSAEAGAMRTGTISGTPSVLARNDDESTELVNIGFDFDFFGVTGNSLYVNNNGNVTFTDAFGSYTAAGITASTIQMIAPFWSDVDTRPLASAEVTYGQGFVDGRKAFTVNWDGVGYYREGVDKLNKFQLVMIDRSDTGAGNFDFEFNYDQVQWETGSASGGTNGLGGSSASAGYSNGLSGNGNVSYQLEGSLVNGAFLDSGINALISNSLNSEVDGRYLFSARNGQVLTPEGNTSTPEPASIVGLLSLAGFGLTSISKKAKK